MKDHQVVAIMAAAMMGTKATSSQWSIDEMKHEMQRAVGRALKLLEIAGEKTYEGVRPYEW